MHSNGARRFRLGLIAALLAFRTLHAQESPATHSSDPASESPDAAATTEALQKATQNPVADLISVPLQNNLNLGIGPYNRAQNVLNIQPVIPIHLTKNWNLITRIIQPITFQPYVDQPTGGSFGLGDMNPTVFVSPAHPGKVIWGIGPTFLFPTATTPYLGQGNGARDPRLSC